MPWKVIAKKGFIFSVFLFGLTSGGQAGTVTCIFTEPFITTIYNTDRQILSLTYGVGRRPERLRNISLKVTRPGVLELRNTKRELILRLERSFRGSDGMSDRVYPYEAHWITKKLYGGCTSKNLRLQ
jgi:uncharacterized membrane protein